MKTCGDGCGRSITSEHVAFQHSCIFVSRHIGKVPEAQTDDTQATSRTVFMSDAGKKQHI